MFVYLVEVSADIPYPWPKRYRQEATNEGAAVSRALKEYRKDVRNRAGKAKRIIEFSLKVRKCGWVVGEEVSCG